MKILMTGGAGFVGSHVTDAFIHAGHDVVVVDNLSTGSRNNLHRQADFHNIDIRDDDALMKLFAKQKFDVVCHHAARTSVRESFVEPGLYAQVNVLGSLNLLVLCKRFGIKKFIYASTGGAAYGEPLYLPVDENHPINPLDPYGASKHFVEHYVYLYNVNFGMPYTILRYSNVYGPRQNCHGEAGVIGIFAHCMLHLQSPVINGNGEQERDFVYVSDIAHANLLSLQTSDNAIINLGTGRGTSVDKVYQKLREITGFRGQEIHGPAKQGEVFKIWLDWTRAKRILGWFPEVDLDEGLQKTVEFLRHANRPIKRRFLECA